MEDLFPPPSEAELLERTRQRPFVLLKEIHTILDKPLHNLTPVQANQIKTGLRKIVKDLDKAIRKTV